MTSIIASKAVIALFNTGAWRTVKRHAAETQAENRRHGLTDEARVDVQICNHPNLAAITAVFNEARQEHYRLTLPAADNGFRLLPGARQLEHSQLMQAHAARVQALVAEFCAAYDTIKADAPARLKGLYVASHWPDVVVVRRKFSFSCRYLPVPNLGQWDEWMKESAESATDELGERLGDAIRKLAEKLADPKAIFRDSLIGNLADIVGLAEDLNLTDDPTIRRLAAEASTLATLDPDTLREDKVARQDAADQAAALCSMFSL